MDDDRTAGARPEAEALAALTAELSTSLDLGHVLQRVAEATRAACRGDLVRIALREPDGAMVYRYLSGTRATGYEDVRLDTSQGFIGRVVETGRPFHTADAPSDPHAVPTYGLRLIEAEGVKVAMVVPIVAAGQIEGVIYVGRRRPAPFTDDDERVCARLAEHAAVAVRNARLYHEARTRQREAESLAAIARTINTLDLGAALQNIADSACALLRADVAVLYRLDRSTGNMNLVAAGGALAPTLSRDVSVPPRTGLVGLAVERREAVVSADLLDDERFEHTEAMRTRIEVARHRVGVAVPLVVQARVTGALFVGALPGRVFSADEIRLVTTFGDQAAVAMANAELYREAQRVNRAKDEFLAMLGHELRNPLGAIAGAVGVLNTTGSGDPAGDRARAVIDRQVQHLSRLVDDLLDVSRLTTGKIQLDRRRVDLGELIPGAMAAWRAAGRFAWHEVSVDASAAWIDADATRIEQILENLVGNALKYTPRGGGVTVHVGGDGDTAVLRVADTGPGMPTDLGDRVFDLFVQGDRDLDRSQGGLGIGLTLVKTLVALHGGTVDVGGEGPEQGAVFTVRLPSVSPPAPGAAAVATADAVAPRRVLIIEDNDDAREMLRVALTLAGHDVHDAADGRAGIETARAVTPDVALIDVGLPGLNGYDVARRLRAEPSGRSMVLIAITGYGQAEDRRRALDAGFDAHVTKPVLPDRLTELISAPKRGGEHSGRGDRGGVAPSLGQDGASAPPDQERRAG